MVTYRKGSRRVSVLVDRDVKRLSEKRGFGEQRLLTHWAEIAGAEAAALCRPVRIAYPRGGFGAVLTVLTAGARAPMVQMLLPALRERVNACYGYNAVSRIAVTQTAPDGFAEAQDGYVPPRAAPDRPATPETLAEATRTASGVGDPHLRAALERMAAHIISKRST